MGDRHLPRGTNGNLDFVHQMRISGKTRTAIVEPLAKTDHKRTEKIMGLKKTGELGLRRFLKMIRL